MPGIFLVKEPSGLFLVLDGHQRLHSLHAYYEGVIERQEYHLENVQDRFKGKRYKDLDTEDRRVWITALFTQLSFVRMNRPRTKVAFM